MAEPAALHVRQPVRPGTLWFAGVCLVTALCLVVFDGIGTGVGASAVMNSRSDHRVGHAHGALVSTIHQVSSRSQGTDDVPPRTKPDNLVATSSPVPAPPVSPVPAPPISATPSLSAPAVMPARGDATQYGCGAALSYLATYSAPGFTFECPGTALGHQAMTCIDEPGVCDNEHLIAIADPCPAAYMNEASNSWVLTGASAAPIDPYGSCS